MNAILQATPSRGNQQRSDLADDLLAVESRIANSERATFVSHKHKPLEIV